VSAKLSPDLICHKHGRTSVQLNTRLLDDDDEGGGPILLIEGSKAALLFLSDLLRAVAEGSSSSFHIDPHGAGRFHFAKKATHGLYMNRVTKKKRRKTT